MQQGSLFHKVTQSTVALTQNSEVALLTHSPELLSSLVSFLDRESLGLNVFLMLLVGSLLHAASRCCNPKQRSTGNERWNICFAQNTLSLSKQLRQETPVAKFKPHFI